MDNEIIAILERVREETNSVLEQAKSNIGRILSKAEKDLESKMNKKFRATMKDFTDYNIEPRIINYQNNQYYINIQSKENEKFDIPMKCINLK